MKKPTNEVENLYQLYKIKEMENGLFKLDKANWKSALVYALLMIALAFFLSVCQSVFDAGSFIGIDWIAVVDKGAVYALGVLIAFLVIAKNALTTNKGNFLGFLKVVPDTEKDE